MVSAVVLAAVPVTAHAATEPATTSVPSLRTATTVTVAGGGLGRSGRASAAQVGDGPVDGAPDGSLLVAELDGVLRVTPSTDRVSVVPGTAGLRAIDVAAAGTGVIVATPDGVERVAADGTRTTLLSDPGVRAVDVGSDGVVWVGRERSVVRVLADGSVVAASATGDFSVVRDLAVTRTEDRVRGR